MDRITCELSHGGVEVGLAITIRADGSLKFGLNVLNDTGVIRHLNRPFFDVSDDSQTTTFNRSSQNGDAFSIADIVGQDFAVRLTSVGAIDGWRDDPEKIRGSSDAEVVDPPADLEPVTVAFDASIMVSNQEGLNPVGPPEDSNEFQVSLLANDIGDIVAEWDEQVVGGLIVEGSNGSLSRVFPYGVVDLSVIGYFDHLTGFDTAMKIRSSILVTYRSDHAGLAGRSSDGIREAASACRPGRPHAMSY